MGTTTCAAASSTSALAHPRRRRRQQGMSRSLPQLARSRLPAPSRCEANAGSRPLGCTFGCTLAFIPPDSGSWNRRYDGSGNVGPPAWHRMAGRYESKSKQ